MLATGFGNGQGYGYYAIVTFILSVDAQDVFYVDFVRKFLLVNTASLAIPAFVFK